MMDFLRWIEQLSLSTWIREGGALYGYALILFMHTIGLGLVAGVTCMMNLRLLGVAPSMPVKPLTKLYPLIWYGFFLNLITGVLLIMADATTKLTNWDFWVKMVLVAAGLVVQTRIQKKMLNEPTDNTVPEGARVLAILSLVCWFGAILAGRLLAYVGPVAGLA
jgi:hypothetical protein